uniref:Proteasome 20S subunit beta 9a n=1 Tax=Cyprinus carpio TaxID=7962 RepID=A0A8C1BWL8_CYPCA
VQFEIKAPNLGLLILITSTKNCCLEIVLRESVENRVMNRLSPLHDKIYCALSGSAADAQTIAEIVNYQLDVYSIEVEDDPLVCSAATLVKNISYKYKEELSAHLIVAEWDRKKGGQVYATLNGLLTRQPFAIGGSGRFYINGYQNYPFCLSFSSLCSSNSGDGSGCLSGGVAYVVTTDKDGAEVKCILGNELAKFFDE